MAAVRNAPIAWAQRENLVLLTIELDTVKVEELKITPTTFKFKGTTSDATYEANFDFYGEVKEDDIKKGQSTRYIELAVGKKENAWWPRLLKDKVKVHWLKVDFGKWKEEDDSDVGGDDNMNFNNFDLSQFTGGMGGMPGGEAPDLGDFGDDEDEDDMPDLEDDEEEAGEKKENGEH